MANSERKPFHPIDDLLCYRDAELSICNSPANVGSMSLCLLYERHPYGEFLTECINLYVQKDGIRRCLYQGPEKPGWFWIKGSKKCHYFAAGELKSVCGKYLKRGLFVTDDAERLEYRSGCQVCATKLRKLKNGQ